MTTASADLLSAAAGPESVAQLYRTHNAMFEAVARKMVGDTETARDVTQSAWQKIVSHLHQFRGDSTLATWATSVVKREALMELRRRRVRSTIPIAELLGDGVIEFRVRKGTEKALLVLGAQGVRACRTDAERLMKNLKPEYRQAVEMFYRGGMSNQEVADALGISLECAKSRIWRGVREMRRSAGLPVV